jgi:predicted transcriptional regulator
MKTYYTKSDAGAVESISMTDAVFESVKSKYKFLAESSKEVKAFLAAQAEAAKPKAVTARQAHEALIRKGLADNIRNAIAGIPDPVEQAVADNWFNRSNSFERDNETLKSISSAIGLTAGDVDNLFAYAATL